MHQGRELVMDPESANLSKISIFCDTHIYSFKMANFHFFCMGGPANESWGLWDMLHPGNFFSAAIINAVKLALKLRSFQLFSKKFQILDSMTKLKFQRSLNFFQNKNVKINFFNQTTTNDGWDFWWKITTENLVGQFPKIPHKIEVTVFSGKKKQKKKHTYLQDPIKVFFSRDLFGKLTFEKKKNPSKILNLFFSYFLKKKNIQHLRFPCGPPPQY